MKEYIVVDQFGNQVAGPFYDKLSAELFCQNNPNWSVEVKR